MSKAKKPSKEHRKEIDYLTHQLRKAKKLIKLQKPFSAGVILNDIIRRLTTPISQTSSL